jgi:GNAT superfamily N-acetyltransferase
MMKIRKAGIEESRTVSQIIQISFQKQAEILNIRESECPQYVAFEKEMDTKSRIQATDVKLMLMSEIPIGTIGLQINGEEGIVERLAILPDYRGKSYGEILLRHGENELKSKGCKSMHLSIVASFEKLRRYYEKLGYQSKDTVRYDFLPFEVLNMNKILD